MRALALATCLAVLAGCDGLDEVDVTRSGTATVPAGDGTGGVPVEVAADLGVEIGRQMLEDAGVDPDDVDSARVRAVRLEVQVGASLETWLDRIAFYAEGGGRPRTLVAERTGIGALPAGTNTIDLAVTGANLKPFVTATDGRITVEVEGTLPQVETTIRATVTIRVDVNVSNVIGL